MTNQKVPEPDDIKAAAQSALEQAQAMVAGAIRIPAATAQLAAQTPDLLENLVAAIERLNTTLDRIERYLAVTDPMLRTVDQMLPRLEALVERSNDVYRAFSSVPGVGTLSRLAGLSADEQDAARKAADGPKTPRSRPGSRRR